MARATARTTRRTCWRPSVRRTWPPWEEAFAFFSTSKAAGHRGSRGPITTAGLKAWRRPPAGFGILPCVYGIPSDATTWGALSDAVAGGTPCGGIWLSHPHQTVVEPVAWDVGMLSPFIGVAGAPVVLWQYLFGSTFDRNLVNPALQDPDSFLESLVLPPVQAPGVFA